MFRYDSLVLDICGVYLNVQSNTAVTYIAYALAIVLIKIVMLGVVVSLAKRCLHNNFISFNKIAF